MKIIEWVTIYDIIKFFTSKFHKGVNPDIIIIRHIK